MARFLLIHGACHGAWAWRDVIPALAALGHDARAIDLPSHGQDDTPPDQVTLDLYAQAILDALDGPTIIVGHSMGGYPISRAAQIDPAHITRLVYVCAYTPWPGLTLADMRRLSDHQPLVPAIRKAPDGVTMTFDPAMSPDLFYHDCPPETVAFALGHLSPQPIKPMETVLPDDARVTPPRSYILCRDDRAIPPELQDRMAAKLPPQDVYEMPTSHSPFFADPAGLAQRLDMIARAT
ncbi:alpha/beta fold hydrolase [Tropicibacter oceani]|uniref:Alpha/beta fold hydrolase n=1 Tax=Tropicibacter oceani TaxID=3058420 RepID=A0ABY8QK33_9RHOB|nr:alpha/beta fold hydrolase [Tropicibacter oceani]WGW04870.1 alpha/beta fold hydrolase [Tropicibacter oceani]